MEVVRNPDGSLIVPVEPSRRHGDDADTAVADGATVEPTSAPRTRVLHPGEGGYDEALAEWDRQQNPDADVPVSTASGREEAMSVVHAVAESPRPRRGTCGGGARTTPKRRVKRCGTCSSAVCTRSRTSRPKSPRLRAASRSAPHEATKIIGEVLAELD